MGRKATPVYKLGVAFATDPTRENYVDLIVAYANAPGEEANKYEHQNVIASLYWEAHFPDLKAHLGHFVWTMLRRYDVSAFQDTQWVKAYFDWLTPEIAPIVMGLEALLKE